jgi:ubiquitin carboxyl-terminal hydrolase L5
MFNLLCVRSAAVPRLERLVKDPTVPAELQLQIGDQLDHERSKAARGHLENSLRRHNLLPAVFALLKAMGEGGIGKSVANKLIPDDAVDQARVKRKERRARKAAGKDDV